jgi:hypothetical protein
MAVAEARQTTEELPVQVKAVNESFPELSEYLLSNLQVRTEERES